MQAGMVDESSTSGPKSIRKREVTESSLSRFPGSRKRERERERVKVRDSAVSSNLRLYRYPASPLPRYLEE